MNFNNMASGSTAKPRRKVQWCLYCEKSNGKGYLPLQSSHLECRSEML